MKFLKLDIENIASLKAKHSIDFSELSDQSNVFAITGDTGSGKSTILNCISLALYGKNYKDSLNQYDFITLNEPNAFVSLEVYLDKNEYRFTWECRVKKKNGEPLKTPKLNRLYFIKENEKWIPTEKSPEEIIKLSFDQFCKTIILNQGDFSKFLTSTFKERKDILERFYDGVNLESLSFLNRSKLNRLKEQTALIESQITGLNESNSNDHSQVELERDILKINSNKKELQYFKEKIETAHSHVKDILTNHATLLKSTERLNRVKIEIKEITELNHKQNQEYVEAEKLFKNMEMELNKTEPKLLEAMKLKEGLLFNEQSHKTLAIDIKNNDAQKENYIKELEEIKKVKNKITSRLESLETLIIAKDLSKIDLEKLLDLFQKRDSATREKEISSAKSQEASNQLKKIEKEAQVQKNKIEDIKNKYDQDSNAKILQNLKKAQETLASEVKKKNLLEEKEKQLQETKSKEKELSELNKKSLKDLVSMESKVEKLLENKNDIQNSLKYYQLLSAISSCQHESIKLNQCVICNSSDLTHLNEKKNDPDLKELLTTEKRLEEVKGKLKKEEELLTELKLLSNSQTKNIEDLNKEIKTLKQDLENIGKIEQNILKYQKEIDQYVLENDKYKENTNKLELTEESLVKLRINYKEIKANFDSHEILIKNINKKTDVYEKDILNILAQTDFKLDEISTRLTNQKEYLHALDLLKENGDRTSSLESSIKSLHTNTESKQKELKSLNKSTIDLKKKFYELTGDHDPAELLEKLKEKKQGAQNSLNESLKNLNQIRIRQADTNSRFKSYNEQIQSSQDLINTIIADLNKNKIDKNKYEEHEHLISHVNSFSDLKEFELVDFNLLEKAFTELSSVEIHNNNQIKELTEQLAERKTTLKQIKEVEKKVSKLSEGIEDLHMKKVKLENLYDLLGRDEFRNFVLSHIEKNLIIQTNIELSKLCDERYEILQMKKTPKSAPEFYVIDKFKGGEHRKVSTLSGGETFIVSLAMALGLSELTRGTRQIDSLFIDEGFGTLDEDSLEDVISMLLNITTRGKTIGLITHVKKLYQRIPVNLYLSKSEQGNSSIRLIYQ
mgnify:CR=1 FL=1